MINYWAIIYVCAHVYTKNSKPVSFNMTAFEYIVKLANYKPLKHKNFVFCNVAVYDESLFTHRWYHCIIRLILLTVIH